MQKNVSVINNQITNDTSQLLNDNNYDCFTIILDLNEIILNESLVQMIQEIPYQNHQVLINEVHEYKKQIIIFENNSVNDDFINILKNSKIKEFCEMYDAMIISEKYITDERELSKFT